MEVSITVTGFSPRGMHTDIRVDASNEWEDRALSEVGKPLYLQSEMVRLLKDAAGQLCRIYQIDPSTVLVEVNDERDSPARNPG